MRQDLYWFRTDGFRVRVERFKSGFLVLAFMDEKTTISALKEQYRVFCEARDWDQFHSPKELAIGVATESAELLEIFRFKSDAEIEAMLKDDAVRERIGHEMADVMAFLLRMSQLHGIDLSDAFVAKMQQNERKYPVEKARGSNKKYTEY